MKNIVKRYRKSINPPYNPKDILAILVTFVILFFILTIALIIGNLNSSQVDVSHAATTTQTTSFLPGSVPGCQFQKADPGFNVAFCDTFDQPMGTGNRSGDLDGLVWGESRVTQNNNPSQGENDQWTAAPMTDCGNPTVLPERDFIICNGQAAEAVNDDTEFGTELAAYPKQPFDIAGRTGTVTFDVTADSEGPHAAWPAFIYTDQPVPAPYKIEAGPTLAGTPRNSFGFSLGAICNTVTNDTCSNCPNNNQTSVDSMFATRNYAVSDIGFTQLGCVTRPTVSTQLNHFEVRISQNHIEVWGTDPGSTVLKELAVADNANLTITRGLIWIEDIHYNACKFDNQCKHTFVWDNVGFDGPVLPRDLAIDVNDSLTNAGSGNVNLGWVAPNDGTTKAVTTENISDLSQATGAIVTFNWNPMDYNDSFDAVPSIRVNGGVWHNTTWPFPDSTTSLWRTIAVPVALTELHTGTNTIEFKTADTTFSGETFANVDIILVGGQGMPTCYDPSNCAATQFGGSNPTPTSGGILPTNTPFPTTSFLTSTPMPTIIPTNTPFPTSTPQPSVSPTPITTSTIFGNTTIGSSVDSGDSNEIDGSRFTMGADSKIVESMSVYVANISSAPANLYQVGIYTDNNGKPGILVAHSSTGSLIGSAWNTLPINATLVANTKYWLMYSTNGKNSSVNNMRYMATGLGAWTSKKIGFGNWPTTFGSAGTGAQTFSIYATFTN